MQLKRWAITVLNERNVAMPEGFTSWWHVKDEVIGMLLTGVSGKKALDDAYIAAGKPIVKKARGWTVVAAVRDELAARKAEQEQSNWVNSEPKSATTVRETGT